MTAVSEKKTLTGRDWFPLLLITAVAFLLRLALCLALQNTPSVRQPSAATDMATYLRLSAEILAGKWPDHFDYQPLYYSLFLPVCRFLGGKSPWMYMFPQICIGSAAVFFTGKTAEEISGKKWLGLAAAGLLAISQFHVFYTAFALYEILQSFWLILWLFLVVRAWRQDTFCRQAAYWLSAGLVLGAATLTRGNAVLLFPGMMIPLFWQQVVVSRSSGRAMGRGKGLLKFLLLAACVFLLLEAPQFPYAVVNARHTGRWCGPSTAGEKVLALGNGPEAPPGALCYPLTYHRWNDLAELPGERRVPMWRSILSWARQEPLLFLNLQWEKLLLFWDRREIPNNVEIQSAGMAYAPWLRLLFPGWGIFVFSLVGMGIAWKLRRPEWLLLYYGMLAMWGATSMFYLLARFRVGSLPFTCIFAGYGLMWLCRRYRGEEIKRREYYLKRLLAVVAALFVCCQAFSLWTRNVEPALYRACRPEGTVVSFGNIVRVYDHGALPFCRSYQNAQPMVLEKRLCIPANAAAKATVTLHAVPPSGEKAFLVYGGRQYPAVFVRKNDWWGLQAELPPLSQGTAEFSWSIPAGTCFWVDLRRDYGRSGKDFPGELAVTVDLQR